MIPSVVSSPHSFQLMVFDGVKNMEDVRRKVNAGEISASLVSTSVLCHSLPLLIAIEKSIQNRTGMGGKMITRTIFTEVLYNLSFTKNITESLRTFGVKEDETSFLAVLFNDRLLRDGDGGEEEGKGEEEEEEAKEEDKVNNLKEMVEYSELITDIDAINSFLAKSVNVAAVRKAYKIKDDEFRRFEMKDGVGLDLTRAVIARVSSKGISI